MLIERATSFVGAIENLQTGDVLLYRTNDLGAYFNSIVQCSFWSHVGLVVRGDGATLQALFPPDYKDVKLEDSELCIFEAVPRRGVALFPLRERLTRTANSIHTLAVRQRSGPDLSPAQCTALNAFMQEVKGRRLEVGSFDMARAVLMCCCRSTADHENWDRFFCSELVAEALQQLGVLREVGLNSNDVLPRTFSSTAGLLAEFCLEGHSYGVEEYLVKPKGARRDELKLLKKESRERLRAAKKQASKKQASQRAEQGTSRLNEVAVTLPAAPKEAQHDAE